MLNTQKQELIENCKSMLKSKIAYEWSDSMSGKELIKASPNYLEDYISSLGKKQVIKLANELISKVAYIDRDCYEDSEGCLYNSIVWKE